MKYFILFLFFVSANCFADDSGYGCRIGDKVYTEYLGTAFPYGPENPSSKYYKNASYIPIYYGYGYNQHQGYKCGFINIYPASSYYNGQNEVPIPAENEITSTQFNSCVTSATLGGGVISNGDYVGYTYNRTENCYVAPPAPLPLDDQIWWMLIPISALGFYFLKKNLTLKH
jgi:hypothetical protein